MRDEANKSLPFSSPSRSEGGADGDGETEGDDTASPVLRRPSTGYLGMGSCCDDVKLEGESVLLGDGDCEARPDEVDAAGGGAELVENDAKEVNLGREEGEGGCQGIWGVQGESRNIEIEKAVIEVGLPMVGFEGSEAKQEAQRVGRLQEAETECARVLVVEEEMGHLGSKKAADGGVSRKDLEAEARPEMVDMSTDINGGVGDQTLGLEVIDNRPPSDNENGHGKLISLVHEAEEERQGVLGVVEENVHLGLEQPVQVGISEKEFDLCQVQPASANGDVADRPLAVDATDNGASIDSESGPGVLILGEKDDGEGCAEYLGTDEKSEHLGLVQKLEVEASGPIREEKHARFSGLSQSRMLEGDCFRSSACSKVGVSKDINTGASHQNLEVEITNTVVSVNNGSRSGGSASGRKEAEEECPGVLGANEEIGHLGLKQALGPKSVTEEEHDEFPGLSPLRTSRGGDFSCSVFGIGSEVGFLSSGVFDSDRVRNGCEDAKLIVSGLTVDCPLVKINIDASKTADGHCCPQDASQDCKATCTVERCEELHYSEAENVNFSQCSGNELCLNDGNGEGNKFSLRIGQSLPLQYVGSQKEHCGDNISGSYGICPQDIGGGGEVDHSVQGSPDEDASLPAAQGLTLGKPAHLSTSIETFSSKLSLSPSFQGSEGDAFIGMSACCSNANGSCGGADNGGRGESKSSSTVVLRRSNPKRGASLRSNLADGKYNQLSRTRNNRKNGRKTVDTTTTFLLSTIKISDKLKRKRSWPHRPACNSVWGPVENLIKILDQNVKPANYDAAEVHIQNKSSKKGRSIVGSKKQPKSQKDGNFQVSSAKQSATSDHPLFYVGVDLPTSDCQIDFGNFNKVEAEHKLDGDKFADLKSLKRNGQIGDKDIDSSLTQEASVELGECLGVSSEIAPEMLVETVSDRNSVDPGTSPDSDVYHPVIDVGMMTVEGNNSADQVIGSKDVGIMTSEGATSTDQFSGMGQNVLVQGAVSEDGLHSAVSTCSKACGTDKTPLSVPPLDPNLCAKAKKGKMNGQVREQPCVSEHLSITENLHEPENLNKSKKPSKCSKSKQKKRDASNKKYRACSKSIKKATQKGPRCKSFALESSVPETTELRCLEESMEVHNCLDKWVLPGEDVSNMQSEALLQTDKTKGCKLPSGTKPGISKSRSLCRETEGRRRQYAHGKMGRKVQKSDNRWSTEDRSQPVDSYVEVSDHMNFSSGTVNPALTMSTQQNCKTDTGSRADPEDVSSLVMTPVGDPLAPNEPKTSLEQPLPPQVAWVLCDDCEKWRCISVELANTLEETKCKWTCKDNTDKAFADCSIPQEKTNSEINTELGIPDEEDPSSVKAGANGVEASKLPAPQRASWIPIKSNLFLHRNRKTQTIDEIMVCHCKRPRDGHRGCGDQCLNRMLNIECVKGTCPCGDLCSNQRFQKRKYAKFKWFRCGKKGYGLQLQEDVSRGKFLIEYVGEVLDLATYEGRQRYYASRGQKHFYFMTLNGGEVIDACTKGNLGRFINHSCEPNCRTEKWMINGEVCIGLFAIRDIKKGEEVTFDYNYVRVVGAAAKKCVCGSSECRGYIGGDPLNSEIIVQGDSDEEDIEPVMIRENSQTELNLNDSMSDMHDVKVANHKEISVERKDIVVTCPPAIQEPEACVQNQDDVCRRIPEVNMLDISLQSSDSMQLENTISRPISRVQPVGDSKLDLNSVRVEENVCKPISDIQPQEISLQAPTTMNEVPSDSVLNSKKSITILFEERPNAAKPHSLTRSSRSRGSIKRGRSSVKNLVSHKTKTLTPGPGSSHFEGVEEKLNELLDVDGGISKQNDATRGYLKLLFVTAAEGDVGGCGSQSTRDLSLILDAILKTKSRKVLVDILNKNGLQMLHNIMKQNRGNFTRIPIIRKLLKVFEFLALTGILTPELITKAPHCNGVESFKESILKLANHSDKQVHKIAREFRDKWIPRSIRRVEPSDRASGQLDRQLPYRCWIQSPKLKCQQVQVARDTDAIVISAADHLPASSSELHTPGESSSHSQQVSISAPVTDNSIASGTKTRKRKSRWDHPSVTTSADPQSLCSTEDQILEAGPKFIKCTLAPSDQTLCLGVSKQTYGVEISSCGEVASSQDLMQLDDERPPGFLNDEGPPGFLNDEGPPGFLDDDGPPGFLENAGPPGFLDNEGPPGFLDDEGPPGFGPLQKNHHSHCSSETALVTGEVFIGHPQEIYLSHMTMSYGIPVGLMQQLGTPETGGSQCNQNWAVAPGMPFYPFPPLPSYPRGQPNPRDERQQIRPASGPELTLPSTSGGGAVNMVETESWNPRFNGRLRWPNNGCGNRFHRPQRWNNRRFQRCGPHWPHQKFGRGFRGNVRNGEVGIVRRDFGAPDGVNNNGGLHSNFHQQHN